jgi:hypothetical protein
MNQMLDFVSHELIKDKIAILSTDVLGFEITDPGLAAEIEDTMAEVVKHLTDNFATESGGLDMERAVAHLLDSVLVQLVVITLQTRYIEDKENE